MDSRFFRIPAARCGTEPQERSHHIGFPHELFHSLKTAQNDRALASSTGRDGQLTGRLEQRIRVRLTPAVQAEQIIFLFRSCDLRNKANASVLAQCRPKYKLSTLMLLPYSSLWVAAPEAKKPGGREQPISQIGLCYKFCHRNARSVAAVLSAAGPGGCAVCSTPCARQSEACTFHRRHQAPSDPKVLQAVILPGR